MYILSYTFLFLLEEEEEEEDPERLGLHVDDRLNVPEEDGRIQVKLYYNWVSWLKNPHVCWGLKISVAHFTS